VAEHGAEPHARLLVTGDRKCHDRKVQHEESCDQLDVVFHSVNLVDRRHDRGLSVRSATRRQGQRLIVVGRFAGHRNHGRHAEVVNVCKYLQSMSVLGALFPLIYAALFIGLLLQAFRMMSMSSNSSTAFKSDRTGLRTVHPELLDDNGNVTDEELWSVRFQDLKQTGWAPEAG
jgi:hypothetical protein